MIVQHYEMTWAEENRPHVAPGQAVFRDDDDDTVRGIVLFFDEETCKGEVVLFEPEEMELQSHHRFISASYPTWEEDFRTILTYPNPGVESWWRLALIMKREFALITCRLCGSEDEDCYSLPQMVEESLCFYCHFWNQKVAKIGSPRVAIIGHTYYSIADPTNVPSAFKGHSGRKFRILFQDGRDVTTDNLWCAGTIPEHFWEKLPDNARFVDIDG